MVRRLHRVVGQRGLVGLVNKDLSQSGEASEYKCNQFLPKNMWSVGHALELSWDTEQNALKAVDAGDIDLVVGKLDIPDCSREPDVGG